MAEVIFNQSGAELRIQDGGTHESVTMLEKSIEEDLGSIFMATTQNQYSPFLDWTWVFLLLSFYIVLSWNMPLFTAPFNKMRTLKFEAQPTNGFFAAVNQVFGGSS